MCAGQYSAVTQERPETIDKEDNNKVGGPSTPSNHSFKVSPSPYLTDLAAATEDSSFHVTMKCVTSSSTLLNETSPITAYVTNHLSTRAVADQRRWYVREGAYQEDKSHG